MAEARGLPELEAAASLALGWTLEHRGQLDAAAAAFGRAAEDTAHRREAWVGAASVAVKAGRLDDALRTLDLAGAATSTECGEERARLGSTIERLRGHAHLRAGARAAAASAYALAERRAVEGGAAEEQVDALNGLGALHFFAGELARAEGTFRDALEAAERWDLVHVEGYALTNLAEVLLAQGRAAEAAPRLETALARHAALENDEGVTESARLLAEARLALGDRDGAISAVAQATQSALRVGSDYAVGEAARVAALVGAVTP